MPLWDQLRVSGKNKPELSLSNKVREKITAMINENKLRELSEVSFLGIEENGKILDILTSPQQEADSQLMETSPGQFVVTVDKNQLEDQFEQAILLGVLDRVSLLGHLHLSGSANKNGIRYTVEPSKASLEPSMDDINFVRALIKLNPSLKIKYLAIVANTPEGNILAIWKIDDLVGVKKYRDLDKIQKQEIYL